MFIRLALGVALAFPSLMIVQKYFGWAPALVYCSLVGLIVILVNRRGLANLIPLKLVPISAVSTFMAVAVAFVLVFPVANTHQPGRGSDDDDAHDVGVHAMLHGQTPYSERTYLDNELHQLSGAFFLAAPFVVAGTSALQNLFWLPAFFFAVWRQAGDGRKALELAWLVLTLSPTVLHQVVTGTAHVSNTIYVLLGMWWLVRTSHRDLAAIAWGVTLASRANFLFLTPLVFGWFWRQHGWRPAVRMASLVFVSVTTLSLPWYFCDPANFGPLTAADRLTRFDSLLPHLGIGLAAAMGVLAVVLAFKSKTQTQLFANCAIVQAFPVVAGFVLSTVQDGTPNLMFAAYGTFFAWFVFMADAVRTSERIDDFPPIDRSVSLSYFV